MGDQLEAALAHNTKLVAALQAFAEWFGPLEDNHMLGKEARHCFALAREALAAPQEGTESCDHCSKQFDPELMTHNEDGSWCQECVARWNPPTDPAKQGVSTPTDAPAWAEQCSTCGDAGVIDERQGGIATSGLVACPDCKAEAR